jgi:putative acetyltransferase
VLVGDPVYYGRFGFQSDRSLVVPGVPPEVSLSLRFSRCNDRGTARFHAAFTAGLSADPNAGERPHRLS